MIHGIALLVIIGIVVGAYVYRDAKRRGMNAAVWTAVSVLSVPLGLIVYIFVRKRHPRR